MNDEQILSLFSRILGDLLGDDTIALNMNTRRNDVPNWDSFNYVNFIVAIEAELRLKFRIADVEAFTYVGDIVLETKNLLGKIRK